MEYTKHVRMYTGHQPLGSIVFNPKTNCVGVTVRAMNEQSNKKVGRVVAKHRSQYAAWRKNGTATLTIAMPPIPSRSEDYLYETMAWYRMLDEAIKFAVGKTKIKPAELSVINVPSKIVEHAADVLGFDRYV